MATAYSLSQLLLDRLTGTLGITPYDALIPSTPPNTGWVIVYPGAGQATTTRLGTVADTLAWTATVVCCGRSRKQCLTTVDIVRGRLAGVRLGNDRAASPLAEDVTGPILPDLAIPAEPRYSLTLRYTTAHPRS